MKPEAPHFLDTKRNVHLLCAAIALFNSLIFGTTCSAETNYYYYCPRGNGAIAGNDHYLQGKMSLAFPDGR